MQINVLGGSSQERSSSFISATEFTLNPNDKYQTPIPPEKKPFIRCSSSTSCVGKSTATHGTDVRITTSSRKANCQEAYAPTDSPLPSLWDAVQHQRSELFPIRSEPGTRPQSRWGLSSEERKLRSASAEYPSDQLLMKQNSATKNLVLPKLCEPGAAMFSNFATKTFTEGIAPDADSLTASMESRNEHPATFDTTTCNKMGPCRFPSVQPRMSAAGRLVASASSSQVMNASELCTQLKELKFGCPVSTSDDGAETAEIVLFQSTIPISPAALVSKGFLNASHTEATNDTSPSHNPSSLGLTFDDFNRKTFKTPGSIPSSYAQSYFFSPALSSVALTGGMSPHHFSQPETPTMSDFGDDAYGLHYTAKSSQGLRSAMSPGDQASREHMRSQECGGFDGYNLPEAHHASALTLKSLPTIHATSSSSESVYDQKSGKELVESWNDGAEHRNSTTEDFFDDLGYLGGMII